MTSTLLERLSAQTIYETERMNPPPAEKFDRVVQLEFTTGCKWNACTYCTMYKGVPYKAKSVDEFKDHVDVVWQMLEKTEPRSIKDMNRLFIGGGNALSVKTEDLNEGIQYAIGVFMRKVGRVPNRVALYANTRDINAKTGRDLEYLKCGGTCSGGCSKRRFGSKIGTDLLYWGIESGSTKVNELAVTGYTNDDIHKACDKLEYTDIRTSVMIMPGLGGVAFSDEHVHDTVDVLNHIRPQFVTFIGLKTDSNTPYAKRMNEAEQNGTNKPLTPIEITLQTARIIEGLRFPTIIGVHGNDVHTFGNNPVTIGSKKTDGWWDAKDIADLLRSKIPHA